MHILPSTLISTQLNATLIKNLAFAVLFTEKALEMQLQVQINYVFTMRNISVEMCFRTQN